MKHSLALIFAMTLLAGCLKTRAEIEAEQSGAQIEKQTVAQQRTNTKEVVKEKAPPSAYRFEEIDEQLRNLSGRVDTVENHIAQMNQAKKEDAAAAKEKQATEMKFAAYEEELKKAEAQIAALSEEVAKLKAPPAEPVAAGKGAAKKDFETGEDLFNNKKWKEAIVHFSKYRDQNPKGKHYAEATYKIGVSFQELGMKDEARSFLEEVTAKFPNTKEGKKAALRLKSTK